MLQVHPDSTCDICLDPYTFSKPARTPHAIMACGHVFCSQCLHNPECPMSCPLCRKAFGLDRVKKLHVEQHVPGEQEAAMPKAWSLVQRLTRCARSKVSIKTTDKLIKEAQQWLEASNHKELFPEVDSVLLALIKCKSLQKRFYDQEKKIRSLTTRLHRKEVKIGGKMGDKGRKAADTNKAAPGVMTEMKSAMPSIWRGRLRMRRRREAREVSAKTGRRG